MRQLVIKITHWPQRLVWRLYSRIILRFALRPRDARWYMGLAVVAIVGAYAGRWHWLFPAVAWSFVTLVAVASQTLTFAERILTEAHEEIVQGYEARLEELSWEVRNAKDISKETTEVTSGYIQALKQLNAHTEEELHHTRSIAERYERELSASKPGGKGRAGRPKGATWLPPEVRDAVARKAIELRSTVPPTPWIEIEHQLAVPEKTLRRYIRDLPRDKNPNNSEGE